MIYTIHVRAYDNQSKMPFTDNYVRVNYPTILATFDGFLRKGIEPMLINHRRNLLPQRANGCGGE